MEKSPKIRSKKTEFEISPTGHQCQKCSFRYGWLSNAFESFHHFTPDEATHILRDAVQSKQPIAVFEFQRPSLSMPLHIHQLVPISPWLHLFIPFSWKKLFLTIVPIIPFIIVLDGIVSVLRTYSTEELDVATKAGCDGYRWEIRQSKDLGNGLMTCLIGWPDNNDGVHIIEYEYSTVFYSTSYSFGYVYDLYLYIMLENPQCFPFLFFLQVVSENEFLNPKLGDTSTDTNVIEDSGIEEPQYSFSFVIYDPHIIGVSDHSQRPRRLWSG